MALIKTWPDSTSTLYDNKQWKWNEWAIGTPITQNKLENLENGISILATQIKAILGEFNPSSLDGAQLNASRLDKVQEWITGSSSTTYDGTNIVSRLSSIDTLNTQQNNRLNSIESINTTQSTDISSLKTRATNLENRTTAIEALNTTQNGRLDSIENKNTEQDGRLDSIETLNTQQNNKLSAIMSEIGGTGSDGTTTTYGGTSRIDSLATEVWGSNTTSGTSRIDKNDNKIAALANELGGGTPDGTSTTYPTAATRLDDLEKEIGGTRSAGSGYTNSRIDTLESTTSAHTTELSAIATEVWGTDTTSGDSRIDKLTTELYGSNTTNYDSTSRLDSAITKLSTVTTELYGSDSTSVTSRLDDLEKEVGGTRTSNGTGYTNSRIDTLESISTSYGTRLNGVESKNTAQDNMLAAIMSELGGTGNDGSNTTYGGTSRLDTVITEIWGSNTTSGNSRLDNIETHDATVDKAIAAIKNELGGTYVENSGFTNSRIDDIETLNTTQNTRLDSIEALNTTQNNRLDTLTTEIYGSNDTSIASRLDDLEKEVCGETIARADNGGYNNSRIDGLEQKVGNGAIGTDSDISAAIRRLSGTVTALDPTGSAEATGFLVSEVWGQTFSENTDFTANSRIDNLETTTQNLGTQLTTLATEQDELGQNLAATNEKIPIEMYIATNQSASDTIVLNDAPRDKSIFFVAIPYGTLGENSLKLETNDITFRDENSTSATIKKNFNDFLIAKFPQNSLISIYRNGANAYAYNIPMVL